jgi:hypothetical protein
MTRPDLDLSLLGIGVTLMLMLVPLTMDLAARWFVANTVILTMVLP